MASPIVVIIPRAHLQPEPVMSGAAHIVFVDPGVDAAEDNARPARGAEKPEMRSTDDLLPSKSEE